MFITKNPTTIIFDFKHEIDKEVLLTAWHVGGYVSAKLKSEEWGSKVVTLLSEYIRIQRPDVKGYGRSNIYNMVKFYDEYSSKTFLTIVEKYLNSEFVQPRIGQIGINQILLPQETSILEFYLEALDRDVKRSNENPSIGIILCPTADHVVVEYAMSRSMSPTMITEYKRILIPQERMQKQLNEFCNLFLNKEFAKGKI